MTDKNYIQDYANKHGISLADLARACGISPQTLNVRKQGNWRLKASAKELIFINPKSDSDRRHHSIKGAAWLM